MPSQNHLYLAIVGTALSMMSCGHQSTMTSSSVQAAAEDSPDILQGVGYQGKPCTLTRQRGADGKLERLEFKGDFKVDYKIPAPGSGLFGVHYWPATFESAVNMASRWSTKRSLLGDADVVEGEGKPLLWDGTMHHKLVFKPSLDKPRSVTYHSVERILVAVPFVVLDGFCEF